MAGVRYQIRVVGEGRNRASGTLAQVTAQALDLVATSSYTVSIRQSTDGKGVFRLRRIDGQIVGEWEAAPNLARGVSPDAPAWCADVLRLSEELGRKVTCPTT